MIDSFLEMKSRNQSDKIAFPTIPIQSDDNTIDISKEKSRENEKVILLNQ